MAASDFIDCDLQTLTLPEIIAGLLSVDENDCRAIRYMTAADTDAPFDCEDVLYADSDEALLQILRKAIGVDVNGNLALRMALTTLV